MSQPTPVAPSERLPTLDIVRGFALLGIFIMNMPYFGVSFWQGIDGTHLWPDALNRTAETVRDALFAGKFNSMFSMLLGLGFTIQYGRLRQRAPESATAIYVRRLVFLFLLGCAHAIFLWHGDVLHIYALLGLLLLALRNSSDRTIYGLIAFFVLLPVAISFARALTVTPADMAALEQLSKAWIATNNQAYGSGSWLAATAEHAREMLFNYSNPTTLRWTLAFYCELGTTMLMGFLIGRHQLHLRIPELMPQIRRLQWLALAVGLICATVFATLGVIYKPMDITLWRVVGGIAFIVCRVALMSFYVLTIVRAVQSPRWGALLAPLGATGRLPLSNYLLQSLMAAFIFYGWGLGYWNQIGPAWQLLLAIGLFFVIQVPLSAWYVRHFRYGPVEYLWRLVTYGASAVRKAGGSTALASTAR